MCGIIGFTTVKKMLFSFDLYINMSMLQRLTTFTGFGVYSPGEAEEEEKEREHTTLQDKLDKELLELDKRLEQKEVNEISDVYPLESMNEGIDF